MKILGIKRAKRFSPNSEDRDTAILQAVADRLTHNYNHEVHLIDEQEFTLSETDDADAVFSMARSRNALRLLAEAKQNGLSVFNSAEGLLALSRRHITDVCREHDIPVPTHYQEENIPETAFPCWLKRDDGCAQQADDVRLIDCAEDLKEALQTFNERNIGEYTIEKHLQGDLVKFYGVAGTPFFHCSYPTSQNGFSKFGLENANGKASGFTFDRDLLKQQADLLGHTLAVEIYGGDAIVSPDGTCSIIDFNDWPSFSACRDHAATAIALLIHERITKF